jgi:hypothetical protein
MGQETARAGRIRHERIDGCRDGIALRFSQDGWDDDETVAQKGVEEHGES